jgi:hypothetical protein
VNSVVDSILESEPISRIRRNHGLEHATLHILSQRHPHFSMAGHSDAAGFWLLGDISTEEVDSAVHEALKRMQSGEHNLAVHPNCGTNFVASGTLAGLAGAAAMFGVGRSLRSKLERLPLAISLATVALIIAQPLGFLLQEKVTTDGNPGTLEIEKIIPSLRGNVKAHRVLTRG